MALKCLVLALLKETSHSGLVRTPGARVGLTALGVSNPPVSASQKKSIVIGRFQKASKMTNDLLILKLKPKRN